MPETQYLRAYVTSGVTNPQIGVLPANAWVERVHRDVTEAFNSDGADNIKVGHSTDDDAYATNTDVSSTGRKTVTLGAGVGYDSTARTVDATYTAGGTDPTTGKAHVVIEFFLLPPE